MRVRKASLMRIGSREGSAHACNTKAVALFWDGESCLAGSQTAETSGFVLKATASKPAPTQRCARQRPTLFFDAALALALSTSTFPGHCILRIRRLKSRSRVHGHMDERDAEQEGITRDFWVAQVRG